LRRYLGPQRKSVVIMAMFLLCSITLEIAEPRIAAYFIESVRRGSTERVLVAIAFMFLGVAGLRQIAKVVAAYASERVSWTATNAAREDLAAHVLSLDLSFHESRSPGELIERIDGDINQVADFFSSLIVYLIGNALLVLGILGALTVLDWRMGLTFVAVTLLAYVLLARVAGVATVKWEDDREQSALFFGYVSEAMRATEDLKSSGSTGYAMARFHRHLRAWLPVKVRAEGWGSAIWVVLSLVFTCSSALAFGYAGIFYQDGNVSLSGAFLIVAYATMLSTPIEVLRHQLQSLQQASAAVRRTAELFAYKSTLVDGTSAVPSGALSARFDCVSFSYQDKKILEGLSFEVPAGNSLGLVGRTGAGKSTIADLLFRMYDPSAGRVVLGGVDTRDATLSSLRSQVGFMTQDVQVFNATLRENLTFFDHTVDDARLLSVFDALELRPWLNSLSDGLSAKISPSSLSAGQAQLLALARVFLKHPGLVILDEPSSKLDLVTGAMVERALDHMLEGRTSIIIAHRLDTILRTDRVLVLSEGAVIEQGATAELMADPNSHLSELYRMGRVMR
jgi:ATP-binding cassette subfamily B protein